MVYSTGETVFKTTFLSVIAPYYLIIPIAEKGRVKVNQIYRIVGNGLQNGKIVA
jgi:hypothetical protein